MVREVNNNNLANAKNYENLSNLDVAKASDSSFNTSLDDSASSYGFGQRETVLFVNPGLRPNKLDETYHSCVELAHPNQQQHSQANRLKQPPKPPRESSLSCMKQVKEEQSNLDPAYRSHSLGDLTGGLTFSLGQKKLQQIWSDADENCWDVNNKNISKSNMASSKELLVSALSSPHKSSATKENNLSINIQVKDQYISETTKNQFLDNRRQFPQEKFPFQRQNSAPDVVKPQLSVFQTQVRIETEENNVRSRGAKIRPARDYTNSEENFDSNLESKAPVIRQPLLNNLLTTRQAQNSKVEKNATRELSPMKPKRSLPVVPAADTSERVKRLTEVMRSRIASSSSRSSSQGRQTSESMSTQTNASGRSASETNSDNDAFTDIPGQYFITSDRLVYTNGTSTHSSPKCQPKSVVTTGGGLKNGYVEYETFRSQQRTMNDNYFPPVSLLRRQMVEQESDYDRNSDYSYSEHQPVPQADRSSDSTQTTVTNQSHNGSVMDSGYTTINESDSFILTQRGLYGQPHPHCQPSPGSPHDYHNIVSQHSPVTLMHNSGSQPKCYQIYSVDSRKQSNLAQSRQFGSMQNISSSQAHGSPRILAEVSNNLINQERSAQAGYKLQHKEGAQHPAVRKVESRRLTLDGSFYLSHNSNKPASTAYTNTSDSHKTYINVNNGHSSNGTVKKTYEDYHNIEPKYLVTNSKKHYANTDGLVDSSNHNRRNSDQESNYVNQTPLIPADNRNKPTYNHISNHFKMQCVNDSKEVKYNQDEISQNSEPWNFYLYRRPQAKKEDGPTVPNVELRPKPVPITGRPARGRTLPGVFRINEMDSSCPESSKDLSLFHLLQTHELLPLTVRLPEHKSALSMLQLEEKSICLPARSTPESPKGRTANIGSPGSAFTPVRHLSERSDPQSGTKLCCVGQVAAEFHRHVVFGSLQQGDIIVEVNTSLCLEGKLQYMEKVLRNCSGTVTFTIARLRDTQGNSTPIDFLSQSQRIKSLEAEISRLDDLIQLRDERIKDLTSWKGQQPGGNSTRGTISDLNGAVEGMVIGDDEYVV